MNFRFHASLLLVVSFLSGCVQKEQGPDPQMIQLQQDVRRLSVENQKLLQEIQSMRQDLARQEQEERSASEQKTEPDQQEMTLDRVKLEVEPLLREAIKRIKVKVETPKKGKQFGMRMEYDLRRAVYGLARSEDSLFPSTAKVLVPYAKYLESDQESKSYGLGTTTFHFAYRNDRWVLDSYR
jgi:hypothetical protein